MKITVDVDLTPEEMRRLVGLPDVQAFNEQLMAQLRERMEKGMEGYDPMTLFQPYLQSTMTGLDLFSRMMAAASRSGRPSETPDSGEGS